MDLKVIAFEVTVTNLFGAISTATTQLTFTNDEIPVITLINTNAKYNSDSRIIIDAALSCVYQCQYQWTAQGVTNSDLKGLFLTGVKTDNVIKAGAATVQLALRPQVLTPGISYTFKLNSRYLTASPTDSFVYVTIPVNAPPAGGALDVQPTEGEAMKQNFLWNTFGWQDDISDLPLSYTMSYYSTNPDNTISVKNIGTQKYTDSLMGQGSQQMGYLVTCLVFAVDNYGCTSNTSVKVAVRPVVDITALNTAMTSKLNDAFATGDVSAIAQVVGAVAASINRFILGSFVKVFHCL